MYTTYERRAMWLVLWLRQFKDFMSNNSAYVIVLPFSLEHKLKQAGPQVTLDRLLGCQFEGMK